MAKRKSAAKRTPARKPKATKKARSVAKAKPAKKPKAARKAKPARKAKKRSTVTTAVTGALAGVVASAASYLPGDTDALVLLETDHRRLEDLLKRADETIEGSIKERRELLSAITNELTVHEMIEEQVLYPALKEHPETRDIVLEGYQEHHVADVLVKELHGLDPADERWPAKLKVFKENIEHHIEEEEGPMFRTARGVMSRERLQELGQKMATMKAKARRP